MRSLGLDVGDKRIGVALSDPLGILARPLMVLQRQDDEADISAILALVKQHSVELIIAGLPRSMDGSLGFQAEKAQAFIQQIRLNTALTIELRDERLSTVSAKRLLRECGKKNSPKEKIEYDAAAAAVILQSFLDEAKPFPLPPPD